MHSHINNQRRKILVIANETSTGGELHAAIEARMQTADDEVLIVAPALNTRLRHWLSDIDPARDAAELRLAECIEQLRRRGVGAEGQVGDSDPLQAIDDALYDFAADELVISTHGEAHSNWLARNVVARASERFDLPLTHVEVDTNRHATLILEAA